jgi:hypothetical protein
MEGAVAAAWLPLVHYRPRNSLHKGSQFVGIQLAVMIPVGTGKLHFQESKYLILGYRLGRRYRANIVLNCHKKASPAVNRKPRFKPG